MVSSRLTKEEEKGGGRRVKGVIYRGEEVLGSTGHRVHLATPLHATVRHRSRVYERRLRWCTLVLVGDGGIQEGGGREGRSRYVREFTGHARIVNLRGHGRNGTEHETGADL